MNLRRWKSAAEPAEPAEALPDWLQDAGPPPEGEELPDLDALPEPMAVEPEIEEEALRRSRMKFHRG